MALDLAKQVGPLPLGAWVVLTAGGLGIAWYTRGQTAAAEPEPQENVGGQPGVGDGTVGGWVPQTPPTATSPVAVRPTNNEEWATYVITELIGRYNYDPNLVDSAIRKYIAGLKLSVSEYVIVGQALRIMAPPVPLPPNEGGGPTPVQPRPPTPPKSVPGPVKAPPKPPVKKPAPAKPAARYYVVRPGDTLAKIGRRYNKSWQSIYNANRAKIKNPNLIFPGQRLLIP